jgi:flagellar motor switch/type III secretory pathway protein FliN
MATIDQVSLDVQVVLGSTDMPVHQVLRLGRGAIIELDATEDAVGGQGIAAARRTHADPAAG